MDARELNFPDASFDFFMGYGILHHLLCVSGFS